MLLGKQAKASWIVSKIWTYADGSDQIFIPLQRSSHGSLSLDRDLISKKSFCLTANVGTLKSNLENLFTFVSEAVVEKLSNVYDIFLAAHCLLCSLVKPEVLIVKEENYPNRLNTRETSDYADVDMGWEGGS